MFNSENGLRATLFHWSVFPSFSSMSPLYRFASPFHYVKYNPYTTVHVSLFPLALFLNLHWHHFQSLRYSTNIRNYDDSKFNTLFQCSVVFTSNRSLIPKCYWLLFRCSLLMCRNSNALLSRCRCRNSADDVYYNYRSPYRPSEHVRDNQFGSRSGEPVVLPRATVQTPYLGWITGLRFGSDYLMSVSAEHQQCSAVGANWRHYD